MTLDNLILCLKDKETGVFERSLIEYLKTSENTINDKDEDKKTLLMHAAIEGKLEVLGILLARGAKVNEEDKVGRTALSRAIVIHSKVSNHNNEGMLHVLLEVGANINHLDGRGWTPLMLASSYNNFRAVQLLMESKADINTIGTGGMTAVMSATIFSCSSMIEYLCDHGADPNLKSKKETAAICKAIFNQSESSIESLIKYGAKLPSNMTISPQFKAKVYNLLLRFERVIPKWAVPLYISRKEVKQYNMTVIQRAKESGAEVGRNLLVSDSCCNIVKDYLYSFEQYRTLYEKAYHSQRALDRRQSTSSEVLLVKKRQHTEVGSARCLPSLALSRAKRKK